MDDGDDSIEECRDILEELDTLVMAPGFSGIEALCGELELSIVVEGRFLLFKSLVEFAVPLNVADADDSDDCHDVPEELDILVVAPAL